MTETDPATFVASLRENVGNTGGASLSPDPVNVPMIRHWCEAMDDENPLYLDEDAATASVHGGIVAPPTMLNAWAMTGLKGRRSPDDPAGGATRLLDEAGYVGVVATNSEHVYHRYLRVGDRLTGRQKLVDVSDEKHTGLGIGHFVTTETEYTDQDGEHVGSMFFRILKFRPGTGRTASDNAADGGDGGEPAPRPPRPQPSMNDSTKWFWEGAEAGELRIQSCRSCDTLHHPPLVRCTACGSFDLGHTVAAGTGKLYSYAIPHYPQVPAFDYPHIVGLVELDEGTRMVTNVTGVRPEQLHIGQPLELHWRRVEGETTLHQFRPAREPRRTDTLRYESVSVGDALPLCPIPITPTLIVSTALASRDFQDVHHDRDLAHQKGSEDIFMNILTTGGLSGRWISDWAGPEALFRNLKFRLGAPNYPYDTMTMSGAVSEKTTGANGEGLVTIAFDGLNSRGAHVTGTAQLALPFDGTNAGS